MSLTQAEARKLTQCLRGLLIVLSFLGTGNIAAQAHFNGVIQKFGGGFSQPFGVAVDPSGNVFLADSGNNVIREILAVDGSVRTFQSGVPAHPTSIALDKANNLYIGSAAPTITELRAPSYAGFSTYGVGLGSTQGLAVDSAGDVFAAVASSNSIVELVATGGSLANNPQQIVWKNPAWFNSVEGIAFDSVGNLFVADPIDHAVRELGAISGHIPTTPFVTTVASGFTTPFALAVDASNNLYVTEVFNGDAPAVLKKVTAAGGYTMVTVLATGFVNGPKLSNPSGVAVNNQTGNVYVGDTAASSLGLYGSGPVDFGTIQMGSPGQGYSIPFYYHSSGSLAPAGPIVVLNSAVPSPDFFDLGSGTCKSMSSNNQGDQCYVDIMFKPSQFGARTATLQIQDINGTTIAQAQLKGSGSVISSTITGYDHPEGLATDSSGNVYVADTLNRRIVPLVGSGLSVSAAVAFGGFAFDRNGNLFFGDMLHNTVVEATGSGSAVSSATVVPGLSGPRAVALDGAGNLFIADSNTGTLKESKAPGYGPAVVVAPFQKVVHPVSIAISKKTGNLFVSTGSGVRIFTQTGTGYTDQGLPTYFDGTAGLALDSNDNLFVVETGTASVRMLTAGYNNPPITIPTLKPLLNPQGIVVDANGVVYVTDTNNNQVVKIVLTAGGAFQN